MIFGLDCIVTALSGTADRQSTSGFSGSKPAPPLDLPGGVV